jgi:hypothetical protein
VVEALYYKPEDRGLETRLSVGMLSFYQLLPTVRGPGLNVLKYIFFHSEYYRAISENSLKEIQADIFDISKTHVSILREVLQIVNKPILFPFLLAFHDKYTALLEFTSFPHFSSLQFELPSNPRCTSAHQLRTSLSLKKGKAIAKRAVKAVGL